MVNAFKYLQNYMTAHIPWYIQMQLANITNITYIYILSDKTANNNCQLQKHCELTHLHKL